MVDVDRSRHATEVPSHGRRAVVLAVAAGFVVHSVLVMVWVMPTNPIRDAIGADRVAGYINNGIIPFEQSWSVFAPTPRRAGETVQVRAFNGGTGTTTAWYDITANEDERIRHLLSASRFHDVTRRLGGDANEQLADLTTSQLDLVSSDDPSRAEMVRLLPDDYVDLDEMLTRFGTMYAIARWGDGVTMVQLKIGHCRVPDFSKRHQADFLDVPFTYRTLGWRDTLRGDAGAQAAFVDYVDRAPRQVGG